MVYKDKKSLEQELENPDIRKINEMEAVLLDQEWLKTTEDFSAYFMYRGLDQQDGLRYDITEIPSKMFGKEYAKTKGHYHPSGYGEIYIVLEGEAIYLIQDKELNKVTAVQAKKGEVAIIPPGSGHVTINPGEKTLRMANWVSPQFDSQYEPIVDKGGAAYFYTKEGWIQNDNYSRIPNLNYKKAREEIPRDLSFLQP